LWVLQKLESKGKDQKDDWHEKITCVSISMLAARLQVRTLATAAASATAAAVPSNNVTAVAAAKRTVRSHIGGKPITVPANVQLSPIIPGSDLQITGPLGTLSVFLHPFVKIDSSPTSPNVLSVSVDDPQIKMQRAMWGTTRTLISNAITGITEGYTVPLYLVGVGFRAAIEEDPRGSDDGGSGRRLSMKVGFSHTVYVPIPPHIKAEVPMPTKIVLSCTNKEKLGQFAADIRAKKPPEPFKGKVCKFILLQHGGC
jgi:large subunit ribosomal protein L6